jgi:hypothetical protein
MHLFFSKSGFAFRVHGYIVQSTPIATPPPAQMSRLKESASRLPNKIKLRLIPPRRDRHPRRELVLDRLD